jgi:hypothetical protein
MKKSEFQPKNSEKGYLTRYKELLKEYPFFMNSFQSALISAASVIVSQVYKGNGFNWKEVFAMAIVSSTLTTPFLTWFYKILSTIKMGGVIGQLLVDQLIVSPPLTLAIISYKFFLMQEYSISMIPMKVLEISSSAIVTMWMFWMPQRLFTLIFIPQDFHVLFGSLCSFIWQIILALLLSQQNVKEEL